MPRYWIITACREHVKNGVEGGFAQACHGKATPLNKMNQGDYVIYYSSKEFFAEKQLCQKFTAVGQIKTGDVYQYAMSESFHPFRIGVEFFNSRDIPIRPLISRLDFIPNKTRWGYPFRWGILEISAHDFQIISECMLDDKKRYV
ncbi:EVE domain-containing protein [Kangiella shandongensis]|uniref:EVE domain-containing protein n=1 Tax=Kangiella shandongensis TaxID=2763258 RepID=UPI001CC1A33A|nr:EVE domain-containing protein [Kangiella shandongensis]